MTSSAAPDYDTLLHEEVARYYADPLGFVLSMYPWGETGVLAFHEGPDVWQAQFLGELGDEVQARGFDGRAAVAPIRMAVSKGHGIGGSALASWLVDWIMSTRPYAQGTVTANSGPQLQTKTWAAIQHWTKLCRTAPWFTINAERMYRNGHKEDWFCAPQSCREENSESFAGQHAESSTSFYINDEDSAVPDIVHEVEEGGLTDGEPMQFLFGNPTRSTGAFHAACFGAQRGRYRVTVVDSRTSRFTNKALIAEWVADKGEDSDFVRVRVRGLPPAASDLQYISTALVAAAQRREAFALADEPLVCGLDVARGGSADCVFRFRRGADARSIPPIRIPGEQARDSMRLVSVASEVLDKSYEGRQVAMLFVDGTAIGGPICDRLNQLGYMRRVMEIQFGGHAPDPKFANMRSYMWGKCRDWLAHGAIDAHPRLEQDLTGPGYHHDRQDKLVLESKEQMQARGVASPDDGDALCFVGGTLVRTARGARPIEAIGVGEWVETPFGYSPVMATHVSDTPTLTTVRFSNGSVLQGKGAHQIFTFSRGRVRLDALGLTDAVETDARWRRALWRVVNICSIAGSGSGFKAAVDTFSPGTPVRRSDFCTVGSGSISMALFQTARKCIMWMMTGATTPWRIWNSGQLVPINATIWPGAQCASGRNGSPISRKDAPQRRSGTALQRGWRGIVRMGSEHGRTGSPWRLSAPTAAPPIPPFSRLAPRSVQNPAPKRFSGRLGTISRRCGRVRTAGRTFWQIVIGRRPVAPVSVQTVAGPAIPTYNLTLAEHNVYYANGILVFNCLTFSAPVVKRASPPVRSHASAPSGSQSWLGG